MPSPLTIGIDLGGTQVRAALVSDGHVLNREMALTDVQGGPEAILRQFDVLISKICTTKQRQLVKGVGVSAPGPLDTETGTVILAPTLPGWENFPLRERLSHQFGLPVVVENDGRAAAFGEWKYGAGRGLRHLVYTTISTGIGGGVVVDGHLISGKRGMAAHVGHIRMRPDGPVCSCGGRGCFESLASGTALGRRAQYMAGENSGGFLAQQAELGQIDARHVVRGARRGDPDCLALLKEEANHLGVGFTGLIHLFSPEKIIMGGGVSQAFDLLTPDIHAVIQREAMEPFKSISVVKAGLGENSGLVGAATLVLSLE